MSTLSLEVECTHCVARKMTDQRVKVIATHPWHICETNDDAINIWRESVDGAVNGASNPHAVILVVHKIYGAVSESCSKSIIFVTGNNVNLLGHGP